MTFALFVGNGKLFMEQKVLKQGQICKCFMFPPWSKFPLEWFISNAQILSCSFLCSYKLMGRILSQYQMWLHPVWYSEIFFFFFRYLHRLVLSRQQNAKCRGVFFSPSLHFSPIDLAAFYPAIRDMISVTSLSWLFRGNFYSYFTFCNV